jgi:threonine aldolase
LSVCFSKGLGAPVGSALAGSKEQMQEARRHRKLFGGGMRQAGVLAAAGLFALDQHLPRLAADHENAKRLARGLGEKGYEVEGTPETNIVMFRVADDAAFQRAARERGVLVGRADPGRLRAVTHLDVTAADIEEALERIGSIAH